MPWGEETDWCPHMVFSGDKKPEPSTHLKVLRDTIEVTVDAALADTFQVTLCQPSVRDQPCVELINHNDMRGIRYTDEDAEFILAEVDKVLSEFAKGGLEIHYDRVLLFVAMTSLTKNKGYGFVIYRDVHDFATALKGYESHCVESGDGRILLTAIRGDDTVNVELYLNSQRCKVHWTVGANNYCASSLNTYVVNSLTQLAAPVAKKVPDIEVEDVSDLYDTLQVKVVEAIQAAHADSRRVIVIAPSFFNPALDRFGLKWENHLDAHDLLDECCNLLGGECGLWLSAQLDEHYILYCVSSIHNGAPMKNAQILIENEVAIELK